MDEGEKPIDIISSDDSNCGAQTPNEKPTIEKAVDASSSGKGLPYAPENWPRPGDVWRWKVGKRKCNAGHWLDRSLYPPRHLQNYPARGFHSRLSLRQYIQKEYPKADVDAFFSSFTWKIPALDHSGKIKVWSGSSKRLEADGFSKPKPDEGCKAGNEMCILKSNAKTFSLAAMSCNICCVESGFCRKCCCILCSETVDFTYGGYSFIRCEAAVDEQFICGHVAHIECALRANMAGKVRGSIDLDAEYFCRRCDNKTDLLPHLINVIKTCESLESWDDIEKMLNLGCSVLRGSEKGSAKNLQSRIGVIMAKHDSMMFNPA